MCVLCYWYKARRIVPLGYSGVLCVLAGLHDPPEASVRVPSDLRKVGTF